MVNTSMMTKDMMEELSFSKEDREELQRMKQKDIIFTEECPEVTPDKAIRFKRVNPPRHRTKNGA